MCADEVIVGVWRTNRVVVDLDGREIDAVEFVVGTDFGNNGLDQLTVPLVFVCTKGLDLKVSPMQTPSPVTAFLAEGTMWTFNK
mgnify:CR=1 FL=1